MSISAQTTITFVTLVLQNAATAALTHRSLRSASYVPSTAVLTTEAVKLITSLILLTFTKPALLYEILDLPSVARLTLPALLYVLQNNALYYALRHLDPSLYHILSSLKLLTTAFFTRILLGRSLAPLKYLSLLFLAAGVSLARLSPFAPPPDSNPVAGAIAILFAAICSGLAACYFERFAKQSSSPWLSNIHLSLSSLIFATSAVYADPTDYHVVTSKGLFHGYTHFTFFVILLHALGGILVSLLVRYSNSIVKGYATSIAIILTTIVTSYIDNEKPPQTFVVGALLVSFSTILYGYST